MHICVFWLSQLMSTDDTAQHVWVDSLGPSTSSEPFVLATVLRADDDHLVVRVNGTDVQRQVRLGADAWPLNDSESANTRDATSLDHTHPPALLRWLQARFAAGSFFGDVGPDVLLYVNPLAPEPALWDEKEMAHASRSPWRRARVA